MERPADNPVAASLGIDQSNYDSREIGCQECLLALGVAVAASLLEVRENGECSYRCHSCGAETMRKE